MSLRVKIILIFSFISAIIVGSSSAIAYNLLQNSLIAELKGRIHNIVVLGVSTLDHEAYGRLVQKLRSDMTDEEIQSVQQSSDYKKVYQQLNDIRAIEPELIRYVYTLFPDDRKGFSRFVVDADVLSLEEEAAKSGEADEEISYFSREYDLTDESMELLRKALTEKISLTENELVHDEEYNLNAISAYAPIFSGENGEGEYLGILGLDMSDSNIATSLAEASNYSVALLILSIFIAFVASFLAGNVITKGVIELTQICREFAEKKFHIRSKISSKDEIGQLSSSFNGMAQIIEDYASYLEKLLKAYDNFVPHAFLKLLGKESIIDVRLGDQVYQEMSVLFSDIRAFTGLSETMTPKENFNFINAYLGRVGPLIRDNEGIIDKYIGDAVMALFPKNADDAVRTAIMMQRKVQEYNEERKKAGYVPIAIGVGIHTGKLMLGTVGEAERMNGTVISDDVNLASRLEGTSKTYKSGIVISEQTVQKLKERQKYYIRYLDKVQVQGKTDVVSVYEVFNFQSEEIINAKEKTRLKYEEAIQLYVMKNFEKSQEIFKEVVNESPSDEMSKIYIERCKNFIAHGTPEGWTPVTVLLKT